MIKTVKHFQRHGCFYFNKKFQSQCSKVYPNIRFHISDIRGNFKYRFNEVLSTTILAAKLLSQNNINKKIDFSLNSFRFISNDRLLANNIDANHKLYTETVNKLFKEKYPRSIFEFDNYSKGGERLAFDVNFMDNTNILEYSTKGEKNE